MKTNVKNEFNQGLKEIIELYGDSNASILFNDLVAIGTWPTPENPVNLEIDTVPLPEKVRNLKKVIIKLIKVSDDIPLEKLIS